MPRSSTLATAWELAPRNLDLALQDERNIGPLAVGGPLEITQATLLSFPERETEAWRGEGICPVPERAGTQARSPDALTSAVSFHTTASRFPLLPSPGCSSPSLGGQLSSVGAGSWPCSRGFCWGLGAGLGGLLYSPIPPGPATSLHNPLPVT